MGLKKMYCLLEIVIVFVEIQHFVMKRRDSSVSRHFMHATYYSKNDRLRLTLLFFVGFFLLVFRHKVYGQHGGIGFQKTNLLLVERPQFVVKEIQDWILKNPIITLVSPKCLDMSLDQILIHLPNTIT